MRLVRDGLRMPWKNGGGVTWELWREPAAPAELDLRLSSALVEAEGPFSVFPGVERWLTLVSGRGFAFAGPAGAHRCDEPGRVVVFDGGAPWACTLVDGPVRDFNVFVRRGAGLDVRVEGGRTGRVEAGFVYAVDEVVVDGTRVAAGQLAVVDTPTAWTGLGVGVDVRGGARRG